MIPDLVRAVLGLFTMLFLSCDVSAKGQLATRPAQAFSDARQVALATAAENGDIDGIERAVKGGADVSAVGRGKATALWYAAAAAQKKAFTKLLELGADPNTPNETGESLVGWCVLNRDADYLKLALGRGGKPNAVNLENGIPVLFRAVSQASTEKLELLLKSGADINIRANDGSTAAVFASSARQMGKVLFLLQRGADPFLRDSLECDIALGIFGPNWDAKTEAFRAREQVIKLLAERGVLFDWSTIAKAKIRNLGEAIGKDPPMWLNSDRRDPNPEWVKANPERAEKWYQAVRRQSAPKY